MGSQKGVWDKACAGSSDEILKNNASQKNVNKLLATSYSVIKIQSY